jgi:hypothetical protein
MIRSVGVKKAQISQRSERVIQISGLLVQARSWPAPRSLKEDH